MKSNFGFAAFWRQAGGIFFGLLLLCLGSALPAAQESTGGVADFAALRHSITQYKQQIPGLPFSEKLRSRAGFHLWMLLSNLEIMYRISPELACGFARYKLGELYRFKTGYRNAPDPERLFSDAFSGSFNLGMLDNGEIFRDSQPSLADLKWFFKHLGIKTVINLRKENDYWAGYSKADEIKLCRAYGVVYRDFPLLDSNDPPPTKAQIEEVLKFIDRCPKPVIFHCAHGKGRTGMVAAAYRISRQGWSVTDAIQEARHYGFRPDQVPRQVQVLEEFKPAPAVKVK